VAVDPSRLMTHSLRSAFWGQQAARIMAAALEAVDPYQAVLNHLKIEGNLLSAAGRIYPLDQFEKVWLVGAGKAGAPMALAVSQVLDDYLSGGIVIVKDGHSLSNDSLVRSGFPDPPSSFKRLNIIEAGHPVPDRRGLRAARQIADLLEEAGSHDLVICLISGGGSALLTDPAYSLDLKDLQSLTSLLLSSGADITEINTLRKHLDDFKGGGLARLAAPSAVLALILSDVIADPLDMIASGPTVPDPTTYAQAYAVLEKYDLVQNAPQAVIERLRRGMQGDLPETPKPGDPLFNGVNNLIIGSNRQAAEAAREQAAREGYHALILTNRLSGEARSAGRALAALAHQLLHPVGSAPPPGLIERPACLIAGGETTVTIRGDGLGGRNQELALAAVAPLSGLRGAALVTLATDGGDGPTPAAGAVVTSETHKRALDMGLDPQDFLDRNDSYHFFLSLDDLLKTGPTLTNVNDLVFLFLQ
jgi:glycerate 2-kinase